jgi:hypothetical protein
MCQAAPLARCASHIPKEKAKIEKSMIENSNQKLIISEEIVDLKRQARDAGMTAEEIMDRKNPAIAPINRKRMEWDRLDYKSNELVRDSWEQELHMDATPTGRKALENDPDAAMRGFRLKNAAAMNAWHKSLRDAKDANGNKILSKEGDSDERRALLVKEAKAAKEGFQNAKAEQATAFERIDSLNEQLDQYETKTLGFKDPNYPNNRSFSRVALNEKDQDEVDYLERQKTSCLTVQKQAHHTQVLERAKLNRLRKAIQLEDEKQEKVAEAKKAEQQRVERYKENKFVAAQYSEDLEKASVKLAWASRDAKDSDESMRLSSKAAAVKTSMERYKKFREESHGNEANAVEAFRKATFESNANARKLLKEAEEAGNKSDILIYTGERQGISLVLDKIRSLKV